MKSTNIQWCDSTVNPTGFQCDGCELWQPAHAGKPAIKKCYAGKWAERIGGPGAFDKPIELKPGRMAAAAHWPDLRGIARPDKPWIPAAMPRLIFIGDMADTFSAGVPYEYLKREVLDVVASKEGQRHIWLWLTKRPKRLAEFSRWIQHQTFDACDAPPGARNKPAGATRWPSNLWVGTSITSNDKLYRAADLLQVQCGHAKRFLSLEPLWDKLDSESFTAFLVTGYDIEPAQPLTENPVGVKGNSPGSASPTSATLGKIQRKSPLPAKLREAHIQSSGINKNDFISWIIVGGESGPNAAPTNTDHLQSVVNDCAKYQTPCFVKQLGSKPVRDLSAVMPEADITDPDIDSGEIAAWEHHRHNAPWHFKDKKAGDWSEWPSPLRIRQFPTL